MLALPALLIVNFGVVKLSIKIPNVLLPPTPPISYVPLPLLSNRITFLLVVADPSQFVIISAGTSWSAVPITAVACELPLSVQTINFVSSCPEV